MAGCRISKVRMKNGATIHILPQKQRPYCHDVASGMLERIDDDTLAIGWFIVYKDRTMATGWSHDYGATNLDLIGGAELLKADITGNAYGL